MTDDHAAADARLQQFIERYEPAIATIVHESRVELRKRFPTATELVYDGYNFLAIGYCATERSSDCVVSIAVAAKGVSLSFYHGADVDDSTGILLGEGKQNRFVRLTSAAVLRERAVVACLRAAERILSTPMPKSGGGYTVIKSVSAKQRPRRVT